jgi:hypothetical protein
MSELKPCPFCGGESVMEVWEPVRRQWDVEVKP